MGVLLFLGEVSACVTRSVRGRRSGICAAPSAQRHIMFFFFIIIMCCFFDIFFFIMGFFIAASLLMP